MDLEPIYCAEQIRIPPNMADVLKAYTKEVIRQQPEDIVKFSAVYFANLATSSKKLSDFKAPDVGSLRALRAQLGDGNDPVARTEVIDRATSLHIDEGTLQKLFSLPMFAGMDRVMPHEVIVLLLTMRATTLREVIGGVFQVFSIEDKMDAPVLIDLLTIFAYQDGGRLLPEDLLAQVAEGIRKVPVITQPDLLRHPALAGRV